MVYKAGDTTYGDGLMMQPDKDLSQDELVIAPVLPTIASPRDVAELDKDQLRKLAEELRGEIIDVVSKNGGHLAPSLGVVELTLALLKVFDPGEDRIVWDVGHQAYAYKLLTGRRDRFHTLRTMGGVSGFPKMSESPLDHFGVGHASTSISAALGMAMGRDLSGGDKDVIAVIGDGSMTAGLAFEGLNHAGGMGRKLVVVLNDNEMSISRSVGALSAFLSRNLSRRWIMRFKREMEVWMKSIPGVGERLAEYARKSEGSFKSFFTPGMLFEALRFNYLGPIDGHNVERLVDAFELVRDLDGPHLVHVLTTKGKGYGPAESNPTYFHGVGCFEPETGKAVKYTTGVDLPTYTDVFGSTLCKLAERDPKIVAITAAMPEGTGLACFSETYPERFVDVGICEQHAVTFAAGLATQGFKPVVAVYSTFMQRSYDQIVHDVCLQNLPVTLCLDRGGLVGEDGPTHHGVFDLSFLRHIPNMVLMAPKDEAEMQDLLYTAIEHKGPSAIRYPRGVGVGAKIKDEPELIPLGQGELLQEGSDLLVIALGSRVFPSLVAARDLEKKQSASIAVFNARFVKPLPEKQLLELVAEHSRILIAEENMLAGGFSSAVLEFLSDNDALSGKRIKRLGLGDTFVEHGPQKALRKKCGIGVDGLRKAMQEMLKDSGAS